MRYTIRARAGLGLVAGAVLILCSCSTTSHDGLVLRSSCTLEIIRPQCGCQRQDCAPCAAGPSCECEAEGCGSGGCAPLWAPGAPATPPRPMAPAPAAPNIAPPQSAAPAGPEFPVASDTPRRPVRGLLCHSDTDCPIPALTPAAVQESPVQQQAAVPQAPAQDAAVQEGEVSACPPRPLLSGAMRGRLRRLLNELSAEPVEYHHCDLQPVPTRPAFMPPDAAPQTGGPLAGASGSSSPLADPTNIEIKVPAPPSPTDDVPIATPRGRERVTGAPRDLPQPEGSRSWLFPSSEPQDIRRTARLPRAADDSSATVER